MWPQSVQMPSSLDIWAQVTLWEAQEVQVQGGQRARASATVILKVVTPKPSCRPRSPGMLSWTEGTLLGALPCASGCWLVHSASSGTYWALLWPWLSQNKGHRVFRPYLFVSSQQATHSSGCLDPICPELGVALNLISHWWVVLTTTDLPE